MDIPSPAHSCLAHLDRPVGPCLFASGVIDLLLGPPIHGFIVPSMVYLPDLGQFVWALYLLYYDLIPNSHRQEEREMDDGNCPIQD